MDVIVWRFIASPNLVDHRCDLEGGMVVEKKAKCPALEEHVEEAVREVGITPLLNDGTEGVVQPSAVGSRSHALSYSQDDAVARERHGDDLGIDRVGHPRIPVDRGRPVENKARVLDTVVVEVDPNYRS
jgi:hypothetical protein